MMSLREVRFRKKIGQWQLAKISGVHQTRISLFENGHTDPRPEEKDRFAGALNVEVKELFPDPEGENEIEA
jgi:transcriptional regulator with XRE-family HTH domain